MKRKALLLAFLLGYKKQRPSFFDYMDIVL